MIRKDIFLSSFNGLDTEATLWVKGSGEVELCIRQTNADNPEHTDILSLDQRQIKDLMGEVFEQLINSASQLTPDTEDRE